VDSKLFIEWLLFISPGSMSSLSQREPGTDKNFVEELF
jgi:hypothetical protein